MNIKYNEHHSSVNQVVPCGRTDMTKLIVAFLHFTEAPKNHTYRYPLMRFKSATQVLSNTRRADFGPRSRCDPVALSRYSKTSYANNNRER